MMTEVTLAQMLEAREKRVILQHKLINAHHCPLICFTMNIAGPIKTSPLIERSFQEGLKILESRLSKKYVRDSRVNISHTGCEAMFAVEMDATVLKKICTVIEESHPLGRLFDMDVLDANGKKLERQTLRGCIVCGADGRACAAGRVHSVSSLQAVTYKIMNKHFLLADREKIASLAVESLLKEVYTTPKPGLVDCRNSGSHKDMDISTFVSSANALAPFFRECVKIGQETAERPLEETFLLLRKAGISAEKTMYQSTDNVNTHKGLIYSMGIICGSVGRLWKPQAPIAKLDDILSQCAKMVKVSVKEDFKSIDSSTAGGKLYLEYGLTGIRGEVAAGFPSVAGIGLPIYKSGLASGLSSNDAGVITLLHLISSVEDTNLYHRGGCEGAVYAANAASKLLEKSKHPSIAQIEKLDDDFILRNLSPGGCADLLAITYFIHSLYL